MDKAQLSLEERNAYYSSVNENKKIDLDLPPLSRGLVLAQRRGLSVGAAPKPVGIRRSTRRGWGWRSCVASTASDATFYK